MKANNIKKKSINKSKDNEKIVITEENKSIKDNSISISSQIIGNDTLIHKNNNNKQEKNIINITMNENEELVYSKMGLDPILLLAELPTSENYIVHIIRTGQEGEQEKSNKNIIRLQDENPIKQDLSTPEEITNTNEEDTNVDPDKERSDLISADKISINEKNELNSPEVKEADEDPRRKRRRSSASS